MKRPISPAYTFNPGAGTLNLSGVSGFNVANLFAVIDLKTGALIYAPLAGYGYTALSGTTLTLAASMTGLAAADPLMIIYDDGGKPAEDASVQAVVTALTSILSALQAQRADTLWTDDTGAYFVRTDKAGTITWVDLSGNPASAPGTGARPAAGTTVLLDRSQYQALAAGTGFALGDLLDHVVTTDPSTGAIVGHFWLNVTQETKLGGAPSAAAISPLSPLPTGAALDASLQAILAKLPAAPALDGSDITTAAMPAGGAGIRGWLSAIWKALTGGLPNPPRVTSTGVLGAANASVALAVDGMSTATIKLTGTWAGTVSFLGSADGGTTFDVVVPAIPYSGSFAAGGGVAVSTATGNGFWELACGGLTHIEAVMTAYSSGTAIVLLAAANGLKSVRVGNPSGNPLTVTAGKAATAGDIAIAAGGTAQTLFGGATPANGWKVANSDPAEDLWVSDSATAAPNGAGSYRIPAGGILTTEPLERPAGPVSVYGATTGHLVTARSW